MGEIEKITALLGSEALERRIAAAIVLGELGAKGPAVVEGLRGLVTSGVAPLQRHALDALVRVGAKRVLDDVFPLLASKNDDVRKAAARAVTSVGDAVIPTIRERLPAAGPDEKRALDSILAGLGGRDAFTALLAGLASSDAETSRAAALMMRERLAGADARKRKSYESEVEKFLARQAKLEDAAEPAAVAAALKILGYLEDEAVAPTLLAYAKNRRQPPLVRQEALIALRFALGHKKIGKRVIDALVDAAGATDRTLAHTALLTLGGLDLPADAAKRLEKLASHPDVERARFVMEQLGRQGGTEAVKVLTKILVSAERRRAEGAAQILGAHDDAVPWLTKALLEVVDPERAWMIRGVLRPHAKKIAAALRKQLVARAASLLVAGKAGWEPMLEVARDADPAAVADALRDVAATLRRKKGGRALTVQRLLCRSDRATDADRYALASLELANGRLDTKQAARNGDEALRVLDGLTGRGFDVGSALRKDRALELAHLYYIGFHFAEQHHPLGEELLAHVAGKAGRTKLGKMAKNKLALAARG